MKDYYATLGVTPQAEDIVIKAAYRALAQRYHPDRFAGSANEANQKMAEINEAYGVLSDPATRKAYDAEYQQAGGNAGDFEAGDAAADEGVKQIDRDWETALGYYPDLVTLEAVLAKTSKSLAFTFRLYMITEKAFKERKRVADALHNAFLTNYFGEHRAILDFAKTLISIGRKDAAKALNEAVRVLGDDLDPFLVISKTKARFGLFDTNDAPRAPSQSTANNDYREQHRPRHVEYLYDPNVDTKSVRLAFEKVGGVFRTSGERIFVTWCGQYTFQNGREFVAWFQREVLPVIEKDLSVENNGLKPTETSLNGIKAGVQGSRAEQLAKSAANVQASFADVKFAIEEVGGTLTAIDEGHFLIDVLGVSKELWSDEVVTWFRETLYPRMFFSPH